MTETAIIFIFIYGLFALLDTFIFRLGFFAILKITALALVAVLIARALGIA